MCKTFAGLLNIRRAEPGRAPLSASHLLLCFGPSLAGLRPQSGRSWPAPGPPGRGSRSRRESVDCPRCWPTSTRPWPEPDRGETKRKQRMKRADPGRAPLSTCQKTSVEMNPLKLGGGARGGSRPPRMGSNASESLLCKDFGKRSEDFCAAVRCKRNGIFQASEKVSRLFR